MKKIIVVAMAILMGTICFSKPKLDKSSSELIAAYSVGQNVSNYIPVDIYNEDSELKESYVVTDVVPINADTVKLEITADCGVFKMYCKKGQIITIKRYDPKIKGFRFKKYKAVSFDYGVLNLEPYTPENNGSVDAK